MSTTMVTKCDQCGHDATCDSYGKPPPGWASLTVAVQRYTGAAVSPVQQSRDFCADCLKHLGVAPLKTIWALIRSQRDAIVERESRPGVTKPKARRMDPEVTT